MTSIWHEPTNRFDALMCVRSLGLYDGSYTEVSSHTFLVVCPTNNLTTQIECAILRYALSRPCFGVERHGQTASPAVGFCLRHPPAGGAPLPDRAGRRRGSIREFPGAAVRDQSQYRAALARPLYSAGGQEPLGDCPWSRTQTHLWPGENPSHHRHDLAIQAQRQKPVELPLAGQAHGSQQVDGEQYLAESSAQAPSREKL